MAMNLALKSERIEDDGVRVSWNDAFPRTEDKLLQWGLIPLLVVGVLGGLLIMLANLLIGVIIMFGSFYIPFFARKSREEPNSLAIYPDRVEHKGVALDRGQITRVEYGPRSQWTGNKLHQHEIDPTQIRLWINDRTFHVVSLNTWETQINHRIKIEIEDAIAAVSKQARADHQEDAHGKTGDYGMPDY